MSAIQHAMPVQAVRVPGKLRKGKLTVKTPVGLPDGNVEVTVTVEAKPKKRNGLSLEELLAHPVFGMWKDREDMKDPHAYARKIRAKFNKEFNGERLQRRLNGLD